MPVQYLNKKSGTEQVSEGEYDDPVKNSQKLVFLSSGGGGGGISFVKLYQN